MTSWALANIATRLFVVLNDNEMSIAPPVGAMSSYLTRLYTGEPFQDLLAAAKGDAVGKQVVHWLKNYGNRQ